MTGGLHDSSDSGRVLEIVKSYSRPGDAKGKMRLHPRLYIYCLTFDTYKRPSFRLPRTIFLAFAHGGGFCLTKSVRLFCT